MAIKIATTKSPAQKITASGINAHPSAKATTPQNDSSNHRSSLIILAKYPESVA